MSTPVTPGLTPEQLAQLAAAQNAPDPFAGQQPASTANPPPPVQPPTTPQQGPPRMGGRPLLLDYIQSMIKGPTTAPAPPGEPGRPVSRGDMTLNFMGQFLANMSQGLAQAGHGPGANLRGAAGAMQAPYQREVTQYGLGQQQQLHEAQIAGEQAKVGLTEAQTKLMGQSVPVTLPNGQQIYIPASQIGQYMRGGAAAQATAQSRMQVAQLQVAVAQGTVAKMIPDVGKDGQRFYHLQNKFGQEIGTADVNVIPSLMTRTSNTIDWKEDAEGNYVPLPKPTVSGPAIPGAPAAAPSRIPKPGGGGTPAPGAVPPVAGPASRKWVSWNNPDTGRMEAGPLAMAPKGSQPAELPAQEVRDVTNARHAVTLMTKVGDPKRPETNGVLQLIDALDKDGKLGVLASRYNSFVTRKVGTSPGDDPRIITLIDKNMLADTAAMLAHFGASGGRSPLMLQHFLDLANSGKMDAETLRAGTKAIADYMSDRAMLPAPQSKIPKPSGGGKVDSLVDKYAGRNP
jgi:hypothetical protein